MSDKLKPCPFCGSEVLLHKGYVSYSVRCDICHYEICRRTKEETIAKWNTRKPMDRLVDQLEEKQTDINGNTSLHYLYSEGYSDAIDYLIDIVKVGGIDG